MKRLILMITLAFFALSCSPIKGEMAVYSDLKVKVKKLFGTKTITLEEGRYSVKADFHKRKIKLELENKKTGTKEKISLKNIETDEIPENGSLVISGDELDQNFDLAIISHMNDSIERGLSIKETCISGSYVRNVCHQGPFGGCRAETVDTYGLRTCQYDEVTKTRELELSFLALQGSNLGVATAQRISKQKINNSCSVCL